jgi:hypothetical protein
LLAIESLVHMIIKHKQCIAPVFPQTHCFITSTFSNYFALFHYVLQICFVLLGCTNSGLLMLIILITITPLILIRYILECTVECYKKEATRACAHISCTCSDVGTVKISKKIFELGVFWCNLKWVKSKETKALYNTGCLTLKWWKLNGSEG